MNVTETPAANVTFPAFERLGYLDKTAYAIPYYVYSSGVWNFIDPDVFPFALSIGTATFCVLAGSYATVSKPANALDPNVEVESQLWDPSDRDDSRYIHTNASDLEFLNGTSIDFKQAVAMPVMSAGALYGLYYCLQNIDMTKLVYYLNWYLLIVSLTSNYSVFDFAITYVVRTISFWLRLPGNSLAVFARYKATLSTDEKSDTFPLGQLEQVSASSFNHGPEWYDGLQRHLARENVEILHPTSIPVKNQRFNFVFDLKFLLSVPLSIFSSALYYLHNPTLNSSYPFDTTNWLLANAMGINFAIFGIRVTRLSNFKVATGLLVALFFYDIYFVFGTKVMVTVATGIDIPIKIVYPRQPNYLVSDIAFGSEGFRYWDVPTSLLGLGDIVIPGAFVSACLRFDLYRHHQRHTSAFHHLRQFQKPYFYCAVVCYICSLIVTVVVLKVFAVGQPALLYIVPSLLLGVYGTGFAKGELKELWQYSERIEEYKGTESSDKNVEESDAEYVDESDDSYDEWEDRVESERAAAFDEVETDSDDIQVLQSDLQRPVSRSLVTYEFADSDDEDDDTFIIDGEEDEDESFAGYAMVSNEEIAILAKDRMTEARAWYSDSDDN